MEGLARDYVATIGGHFYMEPTFWLRQERTCVWSTDFTPVSDALPQPSLLNPDKSFHVQYCELREFNKAVESRPFFCKRTGRHVGMTAPRQGADTTTAIMRRKVSWWSADRSEDDKGWDGRHLAPSSTGRSLTLPQSSFFVILSLRGSIPILRNTSLRRTKIQNIQRHKLKSHERARN